MDKAVVCTSGSWYLEGIQGGPDKALSNVMRIAFAKMLIHVDFSIILMIACENFQGNVPMGSMSRLAKHRALSRCEWFSTVLT